MQTVSTLRLLVLEGRPVQLMRTMAKAVLAKRRVRWLQEEKVGSTSVVSVAHSFVAVDILNVEDSNFNLELPRTDAWSIMQRIVFGVGLERRLLFDKQISFRESHNSNFRTVVCPFRNLSTSVTYPVSYICVFFLQVATKDQFPRYDHGVDAVAILVPVYYVLSPFGDG